MISSTLGLPLRDLHFNMHQVDEDEAGKDCCWSCGGVCSPVRAVRITGIISIIFTCYESIWIIGMMFMTDIHPLGPSVILGGLGLRLTSLIYWTAKAKQQDTSSKNASTACIAGSALGVLPLFLCTVGFVTIYDFNRFEVFMIPIVLLADGFFSVGYALCVARYFLRERPIIQDIISSPAPDHWDKNKVKQRESQSKSNQSQASATATSPVLAPASDSGV